MPFHAPTGPETFLLALAALAAFVVLAVYVAGPLLVWRRHRQREPVVRPREPGAIPSPADRFFNEVGPRLADLGFGETQRWIMEGHVDRVAAELCTMADRARRVTAWIHVLHVRRPEGWRLHSRSFEFVSALPDGRALGTGNSAILLAATDFGRRRIVQLPGVQDPARLLEAHEKLVAREWPGAALADPVPPDRIPERLREVTADSQEFQVKRGWLRRDATGALRLTLRGAFFLTWGLLPPFRQVRRRRRAAREAKILRELGLG